MNIENIELSDFEREVLNYERELLEKAIEISNKNFKFIIIFLRKKQDTLKKEELWKISQILKEYSFSISPIVMSEIMVEIMIEKIISFVAGYAYLECLESGKNFQDFFENYYLIFKELRELVNILKKFKSLSQKIFLKLWNIKEKILKILMMSFFGAQNVLLNTLIFFTI